MKTGWTGGQYSVYRAVAGTYLLVHFVALIPWAPELFSNQGALAEASLSPLVRWFPNLLAFCDAPLFVQLLLGLATVLCAIFAVGWHDRIAAVLLWYIWACLHGRMPLMSNPSMPYVGWLLLAHACLPSAPYGSWSARGRIDPAGGWKMNDGIWAVAWILMALGYSYSGAMKLQSPSWLDGTALARLLENPLARPGWPRDSLRMMPPVLLKLMTWAALGLELGFAPLALFRRARPWLWLAMLLLHLSLMLVIDFADLTFGMVILHFFTFDPAWVNPVLAKSPELIGYDGDCGLCHRAVRFVLAEDRTGDTFRFAPLEGEGFAAAVSEEERAKLPDSIVVVTATGQVLLKSSAALYIMQRLGGIWRILGGLGTLVPARLRDRVYDGVARVRKRIFAAPPAACPLLPPQLRSRFDS